MLVDIAAFVARNVDELEGPPTRSKQLLYDFMLPSRVTLEAIGNNDRKAVSWQRPHVQGILSIKSLLGPIFIYHVNTTNPAQVSCNSTSSKTASRNQQSRFTQAIMNLLVLLPLAFTLFPSVLALPATAEPAKDVDFHAFPEFAGFDNLDQLLSNDTDNEIEERDPAAAQAGPCTLAKIKEIMFDYSESSLLLNPPWEHFHLPDP